MRIVVSGGGTGGHIMPALAVAESLRRQYADAEILYIGGTSGLEAQIVPQTGLLFQAVRTRKLRKVLSPATAGVLWSLFQGYREAQTYLKAFRAQAVVGTGGYVAAATVMAGAQQGLPTLIHEGNVLAGRTNRMLARRVWRVCVTFAETVAQFPKEKTVVTGMPLREGVVAPSDVSPQDARCTFEGLAREPFTLLVVGGSQGAQAINRLVLDLLPQLRESRIQVLHQTGGRNFEAIQQEAQERGLLGAEGYCPLGFLDAKQMAFAMRAASLILCRGGISTIAESLVNGLPSIVVPLPTAYADHQTYNAKAVEDAGAGVHRPEKALTAANLLTDVLALRDDNERRQQMAVAGHKLARPDAADLVVKELLALL